MSKDSSTAVELQQELHELSGRAALADPLVQELFLAWIQGFALALGHTAGEQTRMLSRLRGYEAAAEQFEPASDGKAAGRQTQS